MLAACLHSESADAARVGVQVFMLPSDALLEETTLGKIISSGHSRVPIYHPDNRYIRFLFTLQSPLLLTPDTVLWLQHAKHAKQPS